MTWWLWIILGVLLAAIELATPGGFFVIFFGVSALIVGLLDLAGLRDPAWLQWLLFTALAIVAVRLFRQPLLKRLEAGDHGPVDSLVGEVAIVTGAIGPGEHGRAELRGTTWQAHNLDDSPLADGARARVVAVKGLRLNLRAE
jgi:membrane protein implicated in regulation of membrane protease activity